ncbi:MAG TPA: glycosyltransferase [Thermoanaerobaculia bacterium]|nr:glycosyltransferase [Thermoanaerobaculia bacterium]
MSTLRNVPATVPSQPARALLEDPPAHRARLESSRRAILDAIGPATDITLVRTIGNLGDHLIWAGTRRLLADVPHRELAIDEAVRSRGETAVLMGGGAWCAPFHEIMPAALRVLESRYERVIVLPSSFDVSVNAVRRALERTRAIVFARELESHHQIAPLCRAELALDGAFFFDFAPFRAASSGVLRAFREDAEGVLPVAADNHDISAKLGSLDDWLRTIARHAVVHTDRAHVMIAAALLGKRVEFHASSYHKLPAIASYALADFDVRRAPSVVPIKTAPPRNTAADSIRERLIRHGRESLGLLPPPTDGEPRVTIVVLSWNRLEMTTACIESIVAHTRIPVRLLVVDDHSESRVREGLASVCERVSAELLLLDANGGCAAARQHAVSRANSEYIAFVDNDAEIFPGTIEHLVHALDTHRDAMAAGAKIVLPDGRVQFCGGDFHEHDGVISFEPLARGRAFDDPAIVPTHCRWIGGTTFAARRALFTNFPLDLGMSTYFEDNEWCYRIHQCHPRAFITAPHALALHHHISKERRDASAAERLRAMDFIVPLAHFYARHGLVQEDLFAFVPELNRDVRAARLLLELVATKGGHWTALQWMYGELTPLFDCARMTFRARVAASLRRRVKRWLGRA